MPATSTAAVLGVPIVSSRLVPEVLITAEAQNGTVFLANVDAEAAAIQAAHGGSAHAEIQRNISVADLDRLLDGRKIWCFPGHGDAMLHGEPTLAFVGANGGIEVVSLTPLSTRLDRTCSRASSS